MFPRTRQRKKRTESMQVTAGDRHFREDDNDDDGEEDEEEANASPYSSRSRTNYSTPASLASLAVPIHRHDDDDEDPEHAALIAQVARLLQESDLTDLISMDWIEQIRFFLNERTKFAHQIDFLRTQFEKQYNSLKRRLDETESDNERLTAEHRSATKQLLLYKHLLEAPDQSDSANKTKDFQQLRITIDAVLKENERLHDEIHQFKTSDPVYDQAQQLETTNKNLKQELIQLTNQNHRLKKMVNIEEIKHLKSRLRRTNDESEQLKLLNKKLIDDIEQLRLNLHTIQGSVHSHHRSPPSSSIVSNRASDTTISPLTFQNLRQFEYHSQVPSAVASASKDIRELNEHVRLLEEKLHQRDFELKTLQIEIEKGTSSIMSSIEDLYQVSASVSPPIVSIKSKSSNDDYQNELDHLHDKLDELTRENQTLRSRSQEFETIYEENEYLYAEKVHLKEEIERSRVRELILEKEIQTLKEREKEFHIENETNETTNLNPQQLKIKIEWLYQTNNKLDLEIANLRDQLDSMTRKCQELKKDLNEKDKHYQQILTVAEDQQQLPQELIRLEKIKNDLEEMLNKQKNDYEKTIAQLEEQGDKREQKYSSLYETILKLQNEYRQKELDFIRNIDELIQQRDHLHNQCELLQQENKSLTDEIKSKDEINRDLKSALNSSTSDAQTLYEKFEKFRNEQKQILFENEDNFNKAQQTISQLQSERTQFLHQLDNCQNAMDKFQRELEEKHQFIEQIQHDLSERSAQHVNINNQLTQESKTRLTKIAELEQNLHQEQQRKSDLQRTVQELQNELLKSRAAAKESFERTQELERRFQETDKQLEETMRIHWNETTEPTRRELTSLRSELISKSDQITRLQHNMDEEQLKKQRLEMKLKRLKDEYINVRKELYSRIEEINSLRHELVECRVKNDYNFQLTHQTFNSLKSNNDNDPSTAVQLYIKEKADKEHWQLKCRTYQQKVEQLQKNYETIKEKYKQRLHEEREVFERAKTKYLDHIRNVQQDLQETRQLIEKDAELKSHQESAYQQLIDERRHLLTSMVDKDAKVREMRRENLLLTSKIQLLEDQMENLNDRVDRTLRERNQLRQNINSVRYDSNLSIATSTRSSSSNSPTRTMTFIESTSWNPTVHHKESFGFNNGHQREISPHS